MGYLDEYAEKGLAEERRARKIKRALLSLLVCLVITGALYYWFKNYKEEKRVQEFMTALERGDYAAAYSYWGCKVEAPCPNYDYKSFLEDWGPNSPVGKVQSYRMGISHERGSGVVIPVSINGRKPVVLLVEKSNGVLGFAPPF